MLGPDANLDFGSFLRVSASFFRPVGNVGVFPTTFPDIEPADDINGVERDRATFWPS